MPSLRDSLIATLVVAAATVGATFPLWACASSGTARGAGAAEGSRMYPLAVGNTWTYRCTTEGEDASEKTIKLTALVERGEERFYRAEMRIEGHPKPLVYFLSTGGHGEVFKVFKIDDTAKEVLITPSPRNGDRIGDRVAAVGEKTRVPALGRVAVVRVENRPREDPASAAHGTW